MRATESDAHARSARRILVLGANGQIARFATRLLLNVFYLWPRKRVRS